MTFGEFDNEDDPKISQDSAYTIRLNANKTDSLVFAREKSNGDLEPVSLPAGTTIILRVMDDGELKLYHYELTSAASSIPLSSFTQLGGGSTPLDSSFTGQFIVDFSRTAGGMTEGKLNVADVGSAVGPKGGRAMAEKVGVDVAPDDALSVSFDEAVEGGGVELMPEFGAVRFVPFGFVGFFIRFHFALVLMGPE